MSDTALSCTNPGPLATGSVQPLSVGQLERALLAAFPAADACDWDRTGLLVGDPSVPVLGVAVALDPTIANMKAALSAGCNVLLTHHPVYLDAPTGFLPAEVQGETPGSRIAYALSHGLALINFHTALDVSVEGLSAMPRKLRLACQGPLEPLTPGGAKGFVMTCTPQPDEQLCLADLAARCVAVNQAYPRVWGADATPVSRIAVSGGSANSFLKLCRAEQVDCLVCGEVGYHNALDAVASGLCIIELGHDVSEQVLCEILAAGAAEAGIPESCITMVPVQPNWHTPEASRR